MMDVTCESGFLGFFTLKIKLNEKLINSYKKCLISKLATFVNKFILTKLSVICHFSDIFTKKN